jgi:hypothetical protein
MVSSLILDLMNAHIILNIKDLDFTELIQKWWPTHAALCIPYWKEGTKILLSILCVKNQRILSRDVRLSTVASCRHHNEWHKWLLFASRHFNSKILFLRRLSNRFCFCTPFIQHSHSLRQQHDNTTTALQYCNNRQGVFFRCLVIISAETNSTSKVTTVLVYTPSL